MIIFTCESKFTRASLPRNFFWCNLTFREELGSTTAMTLDGLVAPSSMSIFGRDLVKPISGSAITNSRVHGNSTADIHP
jgi:hypothetical protein